MTTIIPRTNIPRTIFPRTNTPGTVIDSPGPVTPDAPEVDGTIGPAGLLEGDLVFCARPGLLQSLCTRAGEPWRHVGLAVEHHGRLHIAEVAGPHFGLRPIDGLTARYEAVAIGRVTEPERPKAAAAARWTAAHSGRSQVYAWDDLILAGLIGVSRCHVRPDEEPVLERSLRAAVATMTRTRVDPGSQGYTCSSFVAEALRIAGLAIEADLASSRCGPDRPTLHDLIRRRQRPLRAGAGSRITGDQLGTLALALTMALIAATTGIAGFVDVGDTRRWITPGDLWRSDRLARRWYLAP